ncbi:MAG: DUF4760 domain-containing protein [Pseudomonadota bacterium]
MNLLWKRFSWLVEAVFIVTVLVTFILISAIVYRTLPELWAFISSKEATQRLGAITTLSTVITAFAIVGSVLTAFVAYRVTTKTAKVQKTIDYIYRQSHDKDIIDLFDSIRHIKKNLQGKDLRISYDIIVHEDRRLRETLAESRVADMRRKSNADYIMNLLNYYETWAIGIETGALDEGVLKSWWRTNYVRDWSTFRIFVIGYRDDVRNPQAFDKFEALAKRWALTAEKEQC